MDTIENAMSVPIDMQPTLSSGGPARRAWLDLLQGIRSWRVWWLLGIGDIRQRYRRSRIGQFWITLSIAIFVVAIGVVYSTLFKQPIKDYLPYLATTYVVWVLIAGIVNDSTSAFTQAEGFLRQQALPKTTFILRVLVRNGVSFAHNLVVLPFIFLVFGVAPSWTWFAALFGLVLIAVAGFLGGLVCAILSTRFRDLPQIIQNFTQVAFFVSPVTWQVELLDEPMRYWVNLNPFAAFLRVVSEPLLGRLPDFTTYASAILTIIILCAVALPLFVRFRQRIVYWL
ncbi:ABC transporter permease [Microvirga aerophila]|uniref:Sugar ABC transporter permease n=1 Tax=Microvirga aerophila TaxID=670291 RepID=A0A512BS33_9HYPH|nr:ABC transporter permease [Microvirga aerophila]GEO14627.1 sugar ABC transporter permease [Microvirga aerophila]